VILTKTEMQKKLESVLTTKRYNHSIGVMKTSEELAMKYGEDSVKAGIAGLLHDCARDIKADEFLQLCKKYNIEFDEVTKTQPQLLHGPVGAKLAMYEYGVTDEAVLEAIYYHTTGYPYMGMLSKIVYIADYIEPGRCFPGVEEVRKLAFRNIDDAMLMALDRTLKHVITKGGLVHMDTVRARNIIILNKKTI